MLNLLKNDIQILEELKNQIRSMTPEELDAETILDLLNPIIRHKEKQMCGFYEMEQNFKELHAQLNHDQKYFTNMNLLNRNLVEKYER